MEPSSKQPQNRARKHGKKKINPKDQQPSKRDQILQNTEKHETRNWAGLPPDVMLKILMRLNVMQIITSAQKVCSSWRKICKDPRMWTSIHMNDCGDNLWYTKRTRRRVTKIAVDRSCGQLVDVSIECIGDDDLLQYIADRSPQLTRLSLPQLTCLRSPQFTSSVRFYGVSNEGLREAVLKLPLLTYIDVSLQNFSKSTIEAIGRCCPLLKSFIYNNEATFSGFGYDEKNNFEGVDDFLNGEALAIAANMPGLHHLALVGRRLSNVGLWAILDGCSHLVSLDIRYCHNINGDFGKRCRNYIEDLRAPHQIIEPCDWLDLPPELMSIILLKLGVVEVVKTAQRVCTWWRNICKDPLFWGCFDVTNINKHVREYIVKYKLNMSFSKISEKIKRHAIDRSCGQLTDVTLSGDCSELLQYIAHRSPRLTRLRLVHSENTSDEQLIGAVSKLPLLTDIDLSYGTFSEDTIEGIGRCCPLLKSFKFNSRRDIRRDSDNEDDDGYCHHGVALYSDKEALAIATNMPGLNHLALLGNRLSNYGLKAILDGCSCLVSLDLRRCSYINMTGDLGKRCREQIKDLRSP